MPKGKSIGSLREHFYSKLIVQPGGHWRLRVALNNKGYGVLSIGHQRSDYGHRIAHQLFIGPIPFGYDVDHLCRLTWCVNPMHLEAITHSENIRRAYRECGAKLHDMTDPANYYVRKNGGRMCKPCNDRRNRARSG